MADPMTPVRYRVAAKHQETSDTWTLDLRPLAGPIATPRPGQFTMLYAFGRGEIPISVSGLPGEGSPLRHTIRAVGSVSEALCALVPGDEVGVRGPFGTSWGLERAEGRDVVMMAGGIGLAPLRPAVEHVLEHRDSYGRFAVLIGCRTPRDLLFLRQLEAWRGRFDVEVEVTVDSADPGWHGDVGVVTGLLPRIPIDPDNITVMMCGPEVMMRFGARAMIERGVAESDIELSTERNMKCAIGHCGHCQLGPKFICMDGPVFPLPEVGPLLAVRSL